MRSIWRFFAALAVGGALVALPPGAAVFAQGPDGPPDASQAPTDSFSSETLRLSDVRPTEEELAFVDLANRERLRRGLSRLTVDPLLILVARQHSAEMRDKGYFDHNSPTPGLRTPMDRYLRAVSVRPDYACVGENLFYCSVADVQRGHQAFMNSPKHRENVLFPRYEKIGVGIVKNSRGEFWVTQMFLTTTDPLRLAKKLATHP